MAISRYRFSSGGLDWFLLMLPVMILLAYFFPEPGIREEPVSLNDIASYGVAGIFFFYGLKLNRAQLKAGLSNWKMHLLIQATTFIVFPLLALLIKPLFSHWNQESIWLGIFFLCALPSTVSSSVVMVSIAGGNIPAAIFNASISAFIGIFITPLWIGLFLEQSGTDAGSQQIVIKLLLQVLLPVILGFALNSPLRAFTDRHKSKLKTFDQLIILLIIYTSFAHSFYEELFAGTSLLSLFLLAAGMLLLFLVVMWFMKQCSGLMGFSPEDSIAVMFCGSKKSLVHGSVMAGILFSGDPLTGIILLPLMLYHALQLIASSILAGKMARTPS
jgi:sodium/bile acid cotransporter 7